MAPRLELQTLLETLCSNVYFQPPSRLEYPCIVYVKDNAKTVHADNTPYRYTQRYQVTVIDKNPDSLIPGKVAKLPLCVVERYFIADNLNHSVFNLFF